MQNGFEQLEQYLELTCWESPASGIAAIGHLRVQRASAPMAVEKHPGQYEVLYIQSGEKLMTVNGQDFLLRGGDVMVIRPGEEHGKLDAVQNRADMYYTLVSDPADTDGFLNMSGDERRALSEKLAGLRLVRARRSLKKDFDRMMGECGRQGTLSPALIRAQMTLLLDEVVRSGGHAPGEMPDDIRRAIRCIQENQAEMYTVGQLARLAGLSEARFKQKFKLHTGIPPAEYVVHARVDEAKKMLRDTALPVTDVAMRLGFSSSQHFSQLFKSYAGVSPTEYRRRSAS